MTDTLEIVQPDDWHLHLRDGVAMASVLPASARHFGRAIVMPNLKPPVTTTALALAYRDRILAAAQAHRMRTGESLSDFTPLMTLYLTDATAPQEIDRAVDTGVIPAVKLYPAGASARPIVRRFSPPPPAATPGFFSEPTPRLTRSLTKSRPADVPVATRRLWLWPCMPRPSTRQVP
jgi:hypothetical protein